MVAWGIPLASLYASRRIPSSAAGGWAIATLPAALSAGTWLLAWHEWRIPTDMLARGFFNFTLAGVWTGVALAGWVGARLLARYVDQPR